MLAGGTAATERSQNLAIGFAASSLIHLLFLAYWLFLGTWLLGFHRSTVENLRESLQRNREAQKAEEEPPLMFIEVMPEQVAPEPPKTAKFYSSANSVATNPQSELETNIPKIEGTQDQVVKTEDTLRPSLAVPAAPQTDVSPVQKDIPEQTARPKPSVQQETPVPEKGELALVNPAQQKTNRPRRLIDVKPKESTLAGPRMRQEGGVKRRGLVSLDAKATPFGAYDAAIIAAIQQRWYDLLDDTNIPPRAGRVVITFRLHSDGRITSLQVIEEDVGDVLAVFCRRAISDPSPYAAWPNEMRRIIGRDYRDLRFTFYYL